MMVYSSGLSLGPDNFDKQVSLAARNFVEESEVPGSGPDCRPNHRIPQRKSVTPEPLSITWSPVNTFTFIPINHARVGCNLRVRSRHPLVSAGDLDVSP